MGRAGGPAPPRRRGSAGTHCVVRVPSAMGFAQTNRGGWRIAAGTGLGLWGVVGEAYGRSGPAAREEVAGRRPGGQDARCRRVAPSASRWLGMPPGLSAPSWCLLVRHCPTHRGESPTGFSAMADSAFAGDARGYARTHHRTRHMARAESLQTGEREGGPHRGLPLARKSLQPGSGRGLPLARISHDQNFKNLILDYPRHALAFFAPEEAPAPGDDVEIVPLRQEQLQERLGQRYHELDAPLQVQVGRRPTRGGGVRAGGGDRR